MFNKDLTPMYDGRVLMNQSAMKDPVISAVLKDMQKRNWEPLPTPMQVLGTYRTETNGKLLQLWER